MKVSELEGAVLDYWVAKADPELFEQRSGIVFDKCSLSMWVEHRLCDMYSPSTRWGDGGSIIERERIWLTCHEFGALWVATSVKGGAAGNGPLIAAMRCFVASRFGENTPNAEE